MPSEVRRSESMALARRRHGRERFTVGACEVAGPEVAQRHARAGGRRVAHDVADALLHGELGLEFAELAVELLQLHGPLPEDFDVVGDLTRLHRGIHRRVDGVVDDPLGAQGRGKNDE